MQNWSKLLLLSAALSFVATEASASETIAINPTSKAALLDGRCDNDEWDAATKIELPAEVSIHLVHDEGSFYICAKAKAEDFTALDLYIENAETGRLHKFHLSASMGESVLTDEGWENEAGSWNLIDYAGFWVPYSGLEDPENRIGPKFARGTHRRVQVLRKKFAGDTWNMMFGVGGIRHEGEEAQFVYPENAVGDDKSTWSQFSFSE